MTLSTFQKCLFELCFDFSLVVTKKYVSRTSWGLSTWNNTCFLFKCRVTFRLRQFSKATFGALVLYIPRLRCLGISNTYKNSFCSLSKIETFQNWVSSKNIFLSSARLDCLVVTKNLFWEFAEISLHETIRVFCSNAESSFGGAGYQRLRLVLWFFYVVCLTSHSLPNKKQSIFWKCGLCRFGSVQSFWWFPYQPFWKGEKVGRCHQNQDTNFLKCRWVRPKISLWAVLGLFLSCEKFERSIFVKYYLFGCDISCLSCFSVSATSMPCRTWEVALVSVSEVFWTETF